MLTDETHRCSELRRESQNVLGRGKCCDKAALAAKVHTPHSALSPLVAFLHEHFSPAHLWHCMFLAVVGFTGEGSI